MGKNDGVMGVEVRQVFYELATIILSYSGSSTGLTPLHFPGQSAPFACRENHISTVGVS